MSSVTARLGALSAIPLTALALLAPISIGKSELSRSLEDTFHVPLFALVAIGIVTYFKPVDKNPTVKHYGLAFTAATLVGIAGEVGQLLLTSTRHAQLKDVVMDMFGAAIGLCLHAVVALPKSSRYNNRKLLLGAVAFFCVLALLPLAVTGSYYLQRARQAPELFTLRTNSGRHFLYAGGSEATPTLVPPAWHRSPDELALLVAPIGGSRWAGITLLEPLPDWTGYSQLEIDIINPHYEPLTLFLRIDDRIHNQDFDDRFNRRLDIPAHQRTRIRVPLSEVRRSPASRLMALDDIANLVLFADAQIGARAFYLCGMRLL